MARYLRRWYLPVSAACVAYGFALFITPMTYSATPPQRPDLPPDARTAASDAGAFATDLYARLSAGGGNLLFSPYSIHSALAMTYGGARGRTAEQMAGALHFSLPADRLHPACSALVRDLNAAGAADGRPGCELTVANALWGQTGTAYRPAFLELLPKDYAAALEQADFAGAAEPSRLRINAWVEKQTDARVKDFLRPGTVNGGTRLVLTNAVCFKGSWAAPFKADDTRQEPFHPEPGGGGHAVAVAMMHQERNFPYAENETLRAVELPYAGGKLSMVVLLPKVDGGLAALEKELTGKNLDKWLGELGECRVRLSLPKFATSRRFELSAALKAMGMVDAFDPAAADFSGITPAGGLMISEVVHEANARIDEEGAEATAATAVIVVPTGPPRPPPVVEFRADRPFLFLIRDRGTGLILFLGRMVRPAA